MAYTNNSQGFFVPEKDRKYSIEFIDPFKKVTVSGTQTTPQARLAKLSIVQIVLGIKAFYIYPGDPRY